MLRIGLFLCMNVGLMQVIPISMFIVWSQIGILLLAVVFFRYPVSATMGLISIFSRISALDAYWKKRGCTLDKGLIWETVIYWVILVAAALCVIKVSGQRWIASTIILAPVILFCTLFLFQSTVFTIHGSPTGANIGMGIAYLTTWVITGILVVAAILISVLKYTKRRNA